GGSPAARDPPGHLDSDRPADDRAQELLHSFATRDRGVNRSTSARTLPRRPPGSFQLAARRGATLGTRARAERRLARFRVSGHGGRLARRRRDPVEPRCKAGAESGATTTTAVDRFTRKPHTKKHSGTKQARPVG